MGTGKPKILIVDDEQHILTTLKAQLRHQFDVDTSTTAEDGLKKVRAHPHYVAILCDERLKAAMQGHDLLNKLRTEAPAIDRYLITGNPDMKKLSEAVNNKLVKGFLLKPWNRDELERLLSTYPHTTDEDNLQSDKTWYLRQIDIQNFKNIDHLTLTFDSEQSVLPGRWTCLAGLNGAGKTAVLEAVALLLLGEKCLQLPGEMVRRSFHRRPDGTVKPSTISAQLVTADGTEEQRLYMPFDRDGLSWDLLSTEKDFHPIKNLWKAIEQQLFVSYGASRNLSAFVNPHYQQYDIVVQRQWSLFDPMAPVASVMTQLGYEKVSAKVIELTQRLLTLVCSEFDMEVRHGEDGFEYRGNGPWLKNLQLPDGFRVLLTMLTDLAFDWGRLHLAQLDVDTDPAQIAGIVLLDEMDLHLHASLQRQIVPLLRRFLPKIQWLVSTHSSLVLPSFDRTELFLMKQNEEGKVFWEHPDRQIIGFTSDQILEWLLNVTPRSVVLEQQLALLERKRRGENVDDFALDDDTVAVLLHQSPEHDEAQAPADLQWETSYLEKYAGGD